MPLNNDIGAAKQPTIAPWIFPTLLNSWVNYGSGSYNAGYYKDEMNIVHIVGTIKNGTTSGGTTLFVLPAGYRPLNTLSRPTLSNNGAAVPIVVAIQGDGTVLIGGIAAGATYLCLDGLDFRAEQ